MTTPLNNETTSTTQPTPLPVPDGQSELPATNPDYPTPGDSNSGGSGSTTGSTTSTT